MSAHLRKDGPKKSVKVKGLLLALPAPHGFPDGCGISLRVAKGKPLASFIEIAELISSFGCPEFLHAKIYDCLAASGRYDCRVTLSKAACSLLLECAYPIGLDIKTEWVLDENSHAHNVQNGFSRMRNGEDAGEKARILMKERLKRPKIS